MKAHKLVLATIVPALAVMLGVSASAATVVWSGGDSLVNSNWSNTANWAGLATPGVNDDVKFFDTGTNALGLINNIVDASMWIGSLQYGNTNGSHATLIPAGVTLNVTNVNGLTMFSPADPGVSKLLTNVVTGGGVLNISNASARIALNQGAAASPSRATLDLSGLDTFNVSARALGLGSSTFPATVAANTRYGGQLFLARTNVISLSLSDSLSNYQTSTSRTNAIEIVRAPGNNPGITCQLWLGQANTFSLDSLGCGMDKSGNNSTASSGLIAFNPAFTNSSPGASFRGVGGGATTRVKWWSVGDANASSSSSNGGRGTNDFSNGTVDILADVMSLGRDSSAQNTQWPGPHSGVFRFSAGTVDVNTVYAGNQAFNNTLGAPGGMGIIEVSGPTATLRVNTTLILGRTTVAYIPGTSGTNAFRTSGTLSITGGGTVLANAIEVGAASPTNIITMSSGTLAISNAIATPAKGLFTLATTNSTLRVNVTGATNVVVTNLVVGGATNVIFPASVAVFSSYPRQVTLVKYDSMTGAFNFGFGTNTLPAAAPGAYLSNNVANKSIDLVLPTDPRPGGTPPAGFSGSPGANVLFSVTPSGAAPFTFQWRKDVGNIANGPTGNGSTNAGSTTASLSIQNAQVADSGNYDLVITNAYGSFTSSIATLTISEGNIEPSITGPDDTTVIQGSNATLIASVSGVPIPFIQWQKDGADIPGANSASLTLTNAQYPADQATYSIIATNEAGAATNSAVLTVIVPPVITLQPANVVVTNTQAAVFTVAATGVPAPTYQWRKNGNLIANQTNDTLSFASATPADIATYTVVVQNAAGSLTSSNATLTVNSTMTPVAFAPANNATGICFDTPLYITFSSAPLLRTPGTGKIRIFNSTNPATPVDTLDMSLNTSPHSTYAANVQARTIGGQSIATYPAIIIGNTAAIYPHLGVLTTNQTYYVTIENGVFTDAAGAYHAGINDTNTWRFSTRPTLSATAATNPVVNADGSADFVTIQGAIDYLPSSGPARRLVDVRNGTYTELVVIAKSNVTVRGQSRLGAKQQYYNNNWMNPSTVGRMSLHVRAADVAIESLTLTNMTPQGGAQAEALFLMSGATTAAKRFVMLNCLVSSYQDTILGNDSDTPAYFADSTIQGLTDYIWGGATMFFTNCELRMLGSGGQYANPSSSAGSNGIAFVGCTLTKAAGVTSGFLGRTRGITNGNTAFINCTADTHVGGWQADALPTNSYRLWHYGISNLTATVNRDALITNSILLTAGDPRLTLALSATNWLYGWVPQLAPNILSQPTNQTVNTAQTATFTVTATGIPAPAYQWVKNGTNLVGETSASLVISGAQSNDAGIYAVVVSNGAGSVTSGDATLTVNPATAPVITLDPTNQTAAVGATVTFTVAATGVPTPVFQWLKNGTNIANATNTTLVLTNVQVGDSGSYWAVSSNAVGAATSADATLIVTGPNGFCMINGTTTGGAGGATVTVSNGTDFKVYAESTTTYIIQVVGPITTGQVSPKSNKTILGLGTNATILGRLSISGVTNVIVQNLRITNPGDDGISIRDAAKNVWVDHVTFYDCGDGMCDVTVQADFVTVSWCKFYYSTNQLQHRFTFLVGASENEVLDDGKLHITLHHNWWSTRADQRMATVRRGHIHYYNNYWNSTNNLYCSNARTNAQFLSENNYYSGVKSPIYKESNGLIKTAGNIYSGVNPSGGQPVDPGSDTVFTPPYAYLLDAAADVPALVTAGAGAPGPDFVVIPAKLWDGGGADNNLNTANNWGFNETPKEYDVMVLAGNTRLAPNNNFTANNEYYGLTFSNNAGAFVLGGNALNLGGPIIDDSANVQTINLNLDFAFATDHFRSNRVIAVNSPGGSLVINGGVAGGTNPFFNSYLIAKDGPGLLTLAGINTVSAAFHLNGGLLQFSTLSTNSPGSLGDGTRLTFNGGGLRWAAGNTADISARTVAINSGGATLDVGANNVTFANAVGVGGTGGLTKLGTGQLTLNGNNTFGGPTLIGQGTLALGTAGALPNSSQIILSNSTVLDVTGRSDGQLTLGSGKALRGDGTLLGGFTASGGSTVSPGFSIGTLTVSSNITLAGTLYLELDRTNSQTSDKLVSSGGTITYGGALSVKNIGPTLQVGDTFQLFTSAVTGFSSIVLSPSDDSGAVYTWENRVAIDGSIKVTAITERIYVVTTGNQLISFGSTMPGTILSAVNITGASGSIVGIDFRTNTLYALGDDSRLYTLNRTTGAATAVGAAFTPVLSGTFYGMDVEPAGVRVVTDLGQNLLLDFTTGAAAEGTAISGSLTNNSGLAYHPGTGQFYVADYVANTIGTFNPTTGVTSLVGLFGSDFSRNNGFDISSSSNHTAYFATPAASSDPTANLYKVNLGSGAQSLVGLIGPGPEGFLIRGLAVGPDFSSAAPAINPNPTNITFTASGGTLNLSWPASHIGWILQRQTNSRSVGMSSNWADITGSGSLTATNFPLVPANPTVFYRLRLP